VRGGTPVDSGVNIFPVVCLLLPSSVVVSVLTTVMGRFRWAIWGGWVLTTLGSGLLLLLDKETKTAVWAGVFAVFGVGNGMVLTSVNIGTQAISEPENCGRAASMYAFIRTLGMSVGVAVSFLSPWHYHSV
jgi:Na+/melibiose symporter-like transporter